MTIDRSALDIVNRKIADAVAAERERTEKKMPAEDLRDDEKRKAIDASIARAVARERERCAQIAEAIDSGCGNEKEIARAIRRVRGNDQ